MSDSATPIEWDALVKAAEAVRAELANGWPCNPQRRWYAAYEDDDLNQQQVAVIPTTMKAVRLTRAQRQIDVGVMIDFQAPLKNFRDTEEFDALVRLVLGVYGRFDELNEKEQQISDWRVESVQFVNDELFSPDCLYEQQRFETALMVTVRGFFGE